MHPSLLQIEDEDATPEFIGIAKLAAQGIDPQVIWLSTSSYRRGRCSTAAPRRECLSRGRSILSRLRVCLQILLRALYHEFMEMRDGVISNARSTSSSSRLAAAAGLAKSETRERLPSHATDPYQLPRSASRSPAESWRKWRNTTA